MTEPASRCRAGGLLLHPTSLPGPYGIGDLGPMAYAWVDALVRARQSWWQILPLGPTGYGDSPYQCFSAFAGNAYLISPESLIQEGLLKPADVPAVDFPAERIDFGGVIHFKTHLLRRAWENFQAGMAPALRAPFDAFCEAQAEWLEDYALFMALKEAHGGGVWTNWDLALVAREPAAISQAAARFAAAIGQHRFNQFLFFRQWHALKAYANAHGVRLVGDAPIFVAHDSADLWSHPELFYLDAQGRPTVVAGVPPDYFSSTGQLWGNPLYNWPSLRQTGYAWWVKRLHATHQQVDLIRLDHFIGFETYWEVPAGQPTAELGHWVKGPGADLFETLAATLGEVPIIAEDLGLVTPAVEALRRRYGFPGMRILQFAFAGAVEKRFLPHNYEANTVVYTGTHDNNTTRGWFASTTPAEREFMSRYLGQACSGDHISWQMLRLAWASVANLAIAPLQDVLELGNEARMNLPGVATGNWQWRYRPEQLTGAVLDRLGELSSLYDREGQSSSQAGGAA